MDEEQSTKKFQKTKYAINTLGLTAGAVLVAPFIWGMYVYGKTAELVFKTTQAAFRHPWMTTGLLTGGLLYATNANDINEQIQTYTSDAQRVVAEYRIDSLSEKVAELEQKNNVLEKNNTYLKENFLHAPPPNTSPPPPALEQRIRQTATSEDFYLGLIMGAGGTLLGVGSYTYFTRQKKHMIVVRKH